MIEGLFEQDALVMVVGPPGSFKSFLAIDWALSLAIGRPWNERATEPSRVLYALGEGKANLLKRIQAWVYHNNLSKEEYHTLTKNFKITFEVPQLADRHGIDEFVESLVEDGFNPTCLVLDTFARSYVGKNENDPMEIGVWVQAADRLRQIGMTVLTLHHTKKNTEFGLQYRGTTALMGAMDSAFTLERSPEGYKGFAKLTCSKQKDHQEPEDIWMKHLHVRPRPDAEGSIILVETERPGEAEEEEKRAENEALQHIIDALLQDNTFNSDRARAKVLASKTNILETTAQTKIHRARKQHDQVKAEIKKVYVNDVE